MNKLKMGLATLALVGFATLGIALPAQATGNHDECVPSEAYSEVVTLGSPAVDAVYETVVVTEAGRQRYSLNGSWDQDVAPAFPGDNWQANVAGDPHEVGVAGAYFRNNGNSGNVDWFYLEAVAEVTEQVLVTPAIPAVDPVIVEHPAVVCEPDEEEPPVVISNSITTSHTVGCVDGVATVTITLRNVSPWIYPTSVEIDGVHSYGPTVDNRTDGGLDGPQKDQSKTRTITFAEDSGDHTVRYRVQAGSENSLYLGKSVGEWTEFTVDSDCKVNVPDAPDVETTTKSVDTTDCEAHTVSTQEFERHTLEPVYNEESNTWTQGDWTEWAAVGEPVVRDATEEECPTPPVVNPPDEEKPVVVDTTITRDELQYTGVTDQTGMIGIAAALLTIIGSVILALRRKFA